MGFQSSKNIDRRWTTHWACSYAR